MTVRRVVTGHSSDGKAIVASDSEVEGITFETSGWEHHRLWGAAKTVTFPDDGSPPSFPSFFPPVGGFRFGLFSVSPMSDKGPEDIDFQSVLTELDEKLPGMAELMEPDHPGMHRSDTVDFEYIISGEIWLELDDGEEVHLKAGDTVVQNGTRHAWHNRSSEPCRVVICVIGANRR